MRHGDMNFSSDCKYLNKNFTREEFDKEFYFEGKDDMYHPYNEDNYTVDCLFYGDYCPAFSSLSNSRFNKNENDCKKCFKYGISIIKFKNETRDDLIITKKSNYEIECKDLSDLLDKNLTEKIGFTHDLSLLDDTIHVKYCSHKILELDINENNIIIDFVKHDFNKNLYSCNDICEEIAKYIMNRKIIWK